MISSHTAGVPFRRHSQDSNLPRSFESNGEYMRPTFFFFACFVFCTLDIYCMSVWEGSLLCCSSSWFLPFFSLLKGFFGEFFLIRVEALRTEGVICCTDCKAPWGKLWFVILGYRNKNWTVKTINYLIQQIFLSFYFMTLVQRHRVLTIIESSTLEYTSI